MPGAEPPEYPWTALEEKRHALQIKLLSDLQKITQSIVPKQGFRLGLKKWDFQDAELACRSRILFKYNLGLLEAGLILKPINKESVDQMLAKLDEFKTTNWADGLECQSPKCVCQGMGKDLKAAVQDARSATVKWLEGLCWYCFSAKVNGEEVKCPLGHNTWYT